MAKIRGKNSANKSAKPIDLSQLLDTQTKLQENAATAAFSLLNGVDKISKEEDKKSFIQDISSLQQTIQGSIVERQQKILNGQETIELPQKQNIGTSIESLQLAVQEKIDNDQQKINSAIKNFSNEKIDQEIKLTEEKHGVRTFFTKSSSDINSLLRDRICNVEFIRTSKPQGKRIIRCTLNPEYIPSRIRGLGNSGNGLITVWDVELQDYRSFYPSTVQKISYDENPGQVS